MFSAVFHATVFDPLYNTLVFLVGAIPFHDMGFAVIILTIIVRIIFFPLSKRATQTQESMKRIAPEVEALKEKYKDNREEHARATLALYKEHNIRPFSSILLMLVQLPVLFGLYWVFIRGGFPTADASILYSFIQVPTAVHMNFLGIIPMDGHSVALALLASITQFVYTRLSMGPRTKPKKPMGDSFSSDMARSFDLQMRYVFPVLIGVISYTVVAAAPLYWATSNTFLIAQEYFTGKRFDGLHKDIKK